MTEANRKRIYEALLQGVQIGELEAVAADEVETLEPIIDDIEQQAEARGRLQTLLAHLHEGTCR